MNEIEIIRTITCKALTVMQLYFILHCSVNAFLFSIKNFIAGNTVKETEQW
jgi:hypothetical protein